MIRLVYFLPVALVLGFAALAFSMMTSGRNNAIIPSALIGSPAPVLALAPLEGALKDGKPVPALTSSAIQGRLTLINVWASWCIPCRGEHPLITGLAKDPRLNVVGLNYKDRTENAIGFLNELGNSFAAIGIDPKGAAAIDWGVYGIPESYLVGADGKILYKHVGPFDDKSLKRDLLPAIEKALAGAKS